MIDAGEIRKGITIEMDGQLYSILEFQHIKMGRGSAQVRLRLRDIRGGHTTERTFQAGERFKRVRLDQRAAQYLYRDEDLYYFMDTESFEQTPLHADQLGDALNYLKDEMTLTISKYGDDRDAHHCGSCGHGDRPQLQGRHLICGHEARSPRDRHHHSGPLLCEYGRHGAR
jgi:elongation factor P